MSLLQLSCGSPPFCSDSAGQKTPISTPFQQPRTRTPLTARRRQEFTNCRALRRIHSMPLGICSAQQRAYCTPGTNFPPAGLWGIAQPSVHYQSRSRMIKSDRCPLDRRKPSRRCPHSRAGSLNPPEPNSNSPASRIHQQNAVNSSADGSPPRLSTGESTADSSANAALRGRGGFLAVPWGGEMVVQVMVLWVTAFYILGCFIQPIALEMMGFELEDLSSRAQALVHLLVDIGETGLTVAILWRYLASFKPLSLGWFPIVLRPLWRWLLPVLGSCLAFPGVEWVATQSLAIFPTDGDPYSAIQDSLSTGDPVTVGLYLVVISICAPIWEEIIFRGFLLPSLAKWMPVSGAVVISSLIFALAHFSLQLVPPLFLLGIIMGALFVRSRNLLSSIALHSLWNTWVFWQVCCKASALG